MNYKLSYDSHMDTHNSFFSFHSESYYLYMAIIIYTPGLCQWVLTYNINSTTSLFYLESSWMVCLTAEISGPKTHYPKWKPNFRQPNISTYKIVNKIERQIIISYILWALFVINESPGTSVHQGRFVMSPGLFRHTLKDTLDVIIRIQLYALVLYAVLYV